MEARENHLNEMYIPRSRIYKDLLEYHPQGDHLALHELEERMFFEVCMEY